MVPWWLLVLLALAAEYSSGTEEGKIYGGRNASNGEFPFAVYVCYRVNFSHIEACGGTLATLSRIISAGHCFTNKQNVLKNASKFTIVGGTLRPDEKDDGKQERNVVKFIVHHSYKTKKDTSHYHDIAVGELDKPFEQSNTLSIMKVASLNEEENKQAWEKIVKAGKQCTAVGWGSTESAPSSDSLKAIDLKVWTDAECSSVVYPGDENMAGKGEVCLSQVNPKEGVCHGDSGSPLICDGYVFGLSRSIIVCGSVRQQLFLLFWPYLNYFGLSGSAMINSTGSYNFQPSLICLTTILTSSIL